MKNSKIGCNFRILKSFCLPKRVSRRIYEYRCLNLIEDLQCTLMEYEWLYITSVLLFISLFSPILKWILNLKWNWLMVFGCLSFLWLFIFFVLILISFPRPGTSSNRDFTKNSGAEKFIENEVNNLTLIRL